MGKLIYPDLCYKLYGIFYKAQNRLGKNLKERQYADGVELLFQKYKIKYQREIEISVNFEVGEITGNRLDF